MTTKKKTYVLLMSTHFMKGHPRAGDPTGFEDKILSGEKIHTIRANYDYWKDIAEKINRGDGMLSVRKWSGKPYRSKQVEICQFDKVGIQKIRLNAIGTITIENSIAIKHEVARHDGLTHQDFHDWFKDKLPFQGALIYFTDFKY